MSSKKGQFAVSTEWAKHLRKWGKRLFWKSERSKTVQHLSKVKKGEHE